MNIELKNIDELKPYEGNPRVNDPAVEPVARSIRKFGWRVPLVIDENNVVIAGHTRLKAARSLGMTQVPVHRPRALIKSHSRSFRDMLRNPRTWGNVAASSPHLPTIPEVRNAQK